MNICQVLGGDIKQIGGLEQHVLDISRGLLAKSHKVSLIAHHDIEKFLPAGVNFYPLDLSRNRFHLGNLLKLWRFIKVGQFDIVHAHANKACFLLALLKSVCRFNFVATLHGQKKKLWAYSRADHVISVSKRIAEKVSNRNLTVIYNGVSIQFEKSSLRGLCGINENEFLFCAVGRLEKVKGFDLLLRAFASVPAKLVIIGDGTERKRLEDIIIENKLQNKVFLLGFLPNASGYLYQSDAVVISSRREGFSYVFAESLLSRIPVVSTDVADVASIIDPRYIVPTNNLEKLAEKMNNIVDNPQKAKNDFCEAFEFSQNEFVFASMSKKLISVYRETISRS